MSEDLKATLLWIAIGTIGIGILAFSLTLGLSYTGVYLVSLLVGIAWGMFGN